MISILRVGLLTISILLCCLSAAYFKTLCSFIVYPDALKHVPDVLCHSDVTHSLTLSISQSLELELEARIYVMDTRGPIECTPRRVLQSLQSTVFWWKYANSMPCPLTNDSQLE